MLWLIFRVSLKITVYAEGRRGRGAVRCMIGSRQWMRREEREKDNPHHTVIVAIQRW
jgi:hypothetical protein